ncbi:MAG: hypothetical protein HY396_00055 [Candidatus Doudnabacteria bacterium]|nr:hypothetical protein [Candidatus Doudnabacteria bacterium]
MDFPNIIGHEKQKKFFLQAAKSGKLAHAYALVGEENIGKATFALDLAKALGADPVFDVFLVDSEQGLEIAEARSLQSRLSLTPAGRRKAAVISYAERMTLSAANSLLKTLEDPPAHSLLFLTTSNFYGFLPTIMSRIQKVNFTRLSDAEMKEVLKDCELSKERLTQILLLSAGRPGLAKRLAEDEELLKFYDVAKKQYDILEAGKLADRLKTAQELAELEIIEIQNFLKIAMQMWIETAKAKDLGRKLLTAWQDLQYNLNTRLVLDNLFLP